MTAEALSKIIKATQLVMGEPGFKSRSICLQKPVCWIAFFSSKMAICMKHESNWEIQTSCHVFLPYLHYVPVLSIPSAPHNKGAEGCILLGLEEYKHIWKDADTEQTILPLECGQDEVSINNHEREEILSPGVPFAKVDGNWWGCRDIPILLLLEPGVVIYKNVTFPALLSYLCQRLRDQQISIYCCPGAQAMRHLYTPLPTKQAQAPALADSCFIFGNLERERKITYLPPFWAEGCQVTSLDHIINDHDNKIWISHISHLIMREISKSLDQQSEVCILSPDGPSVSNWCLSYSSHL